MTDRRIPDDRPAPPSSEGPTIASGAAAGAGAGHERPGSWIGPYRILQLLGEGGFGSVFMAEQDRPVQRRVAIKIIKLGMDTAQVVARFEQERQALAILDHPNIAKVFDAGATETGRPYFVMELCTGEPIDVYCDRNNLDISNALELFAQVCSALQHAHTKGLIHRDIKPGNILVSSRDGAPHAKVIDFGIAKATGSKLTDRTLFTEFRQLVGTPEYMSPEQAEGSLDIDTRTDIYSLGVLLYELLTGDTPFSGRDLRSAAYGEIQRIIREVDPPRPSTRLAESSETVTTIAGRRSIEPRRLASALRGELDWIVMKAIEKDRQRRYESAGAFEADIRRFMRGEAVIAAPPTASYRLRKFVRRNRVAVVAGALVAASLIVGSGLAVAGLIRANQQRDLARDAEIRARAQRDLAVEAEQRATSAEAEARLEAATATRIADFTASMLSGASPSIALGRDTTLLREVVDATADRVERELADEPVVASRVLRTLAEVYNVLAVYDRAEATARRAVEFARASPGDNLPNVARALFEVAKVLESTSRLAEAREIFQECCDQLEAAGLVGSRDYLNVLSGLGGVEYRLRAYDASEAAFRKVLAGRRALAQGQDDDRVADALDRLAVAVFERDEAIDEAEQLERESLAMRRRLFGEKHPDIALSLTNLASTLSARGRFDEAVLMAEEAVQQHVLLYGPRHPHTASSLTVLADILFAADRAPEALERYREALDISLETLGPNHRATLDRRYFLGATLERRGEFAGAEEQFAAMLAWARGNFPEGDSRTTATMLIVARVQMKQGKFMQAEAIYREALANRENQRPPGHPQIQECRNLLADALTGQERFAEAEPLLLAVEADAALPEAPPAARAAALTRLVAFYTGWHVAEPAEGHDRTAAERQAALEALGPSPGG